MDRGATAAHFRRLKTERRSEMAAEENGPYFYRLKTERVDRDIEKGSTPIFLYDFSAKSFFNYRNSGPARWVGRDTDKGRYPLCL